MSDAAPQRTSAGTAEESAEPESASPRPPRVAGDSGRVAATEAARALFASTEDAPMEVVPVQPVTAVTLSELRHRAVTQSRLLERAAEEIDALQARLDGARRRARSAESALARERGLRGRQSADAARRLAEQGRAIQQLSREVSELRRSAGLEADQRERLDRRLADRAALDERVGQTVAAARSAVSEARRLACGRQDRGERLEGALRAERERRLDVERRLAGAEAEQRNLAQVRERLRTECGELRAREAARMALDGAPLVDRGPTRVADVAAVYRLLERELAAREALELRAVQLIGRLQAHLATTGQQATPSRGSAIISRGGCGQTPGPP